MNYLVVQQHHQNVQIRIHNLMLKQLLATGDVNVSLHIPDVPYISSLTDISTSSTSEMPHSLTFEHLHRHLLPTKYGKNELVPPYASTDAVKSFLPRTCTRLYF